MPKITLKHPFYSYLHLLLYQIRKDYHKTLEFLQKKR